MPLILPGNVGSATAATEIVSNSARFNPGSSDYLSKAFGTGNRKTWTFSTWIKLGGVGNADDYRIFSSYTDNTTSFYIGFDQNRYYIYGENGNTVFAEYIGTTKLRDPSAWYHLVYAFDTTQSTESNRLKIFRNNVLETLTVDHAVGQDEELELNRDGKTHYIGQEGSSGGYLSGYLAETVFIDGAALAPTSFGEFDDDSGIWKPIDVSGLTFGTNGFYLDFEDSSALGNDKAGSNNFAVSNLTAIDQSTDTCVNNFAILAHHSVDDVTLTEGSLKFENPSGTHRMVSSSIAPSQGKWYAEVKMTTEAQQTRVGIIDPDKFVYNTFIHNTGRGYGYKGDDGTIRFNDGTTDDDYGDTYTTGDIIGIAMDLDNHKLYFSKNGTFQNSGDPTSGATGTGAAPAIATGVNYFIAASTQDEGTNPVIEFNFGSPSFAISSGNTDGNGFGNFEYAVPSGYFALCTKNLAENG